VPRLPGQGARDLIRVRGDLDPKVFVDLGIVVQATAEPFDLSSPGKPGKRLVHSLPRAEVEEIFTGKDITATTISDEVEDFVGDGHHSHLLLSGNCNIFLTQVKLVLEADAWLGLSRTLRV